MLAWWYAQVSVLPSFAIYPLNRHHMLRNLRVMLACVFQFGFKSLNQPPTSLRTASLETVLFVRFTCTPLKPLF